MWPRPTVASVRRSRYRRESTILHAWCWLGRTMWGSAGWRKTYSTATCSVETVTPGWERMLWAFWTITRSQRNNNNMTSEGWKRSFPSSKTEMMKRKRTRWRAPSSMYVTRRAIGEMNALPSLQMSKLRGRYIKKYITVWPTSRQQRRTRHSFSMWHSTSYILCARIMRGLPKEMWRGLYWLAIRRYWLAIHLRETLNTWWVAILLIVLSQFQTLITLTKSLALS